jgi:hypothetical protein
MPTTPITGAITLVGCNEGKVRQRRKKGKKKGIKSEWHCLNP